ncbi:MAG: glucose-1-phosphate cytidylyltransferase [Candidatus Binatia bacterium]
MKVVLFCGGLGTRLRDYSDSIPKPMVPIGPRPVLWHVMKYYAYFGHNEFILCLGYKSEVIREYFLNYREAISNDFVLSKGGRSLELLASDTDSWTIKFIDTGTNSSIGERLRTVRRHLEGESMFLANYSDGLSDLALPEYIDHFQASGRLASFLAVQSTQSFHVADIDNDGVVERIEPLSQSDLWINGGFFAFRSEVFEYLGPGEDLVDEPFARLMKERQLGAYRYNGFWMAMDTFKDKQALEDLYEQGKAPWEVWRHSEIDGH